MHLELDIGVFFSRKTASNKCDQRPDGRKAGSALQLTGTLEKIKAAQSWMVQRVEAAQDLMIIPKNVVIIEEISQKMLQEIDLLEFIQTQKHLCTEDVAELNRHLALAESLSLETGAGETLVKQLRVRVEKITTQLPLLKALAGVNYEAESDAEKLHDIIQEVKKSPRPPANEQDKEQPKPLHESPAGWIRAEGFENFEKAERRLEELGGWPPKPKPPTPKKEPDDPTPRTAMANAARRRATVTGLDQRAVDSLHKQLADAKTTYDSQELSELLREATQQGLKAEEVLPYQQLYQKLCTGQYVASLLQERSQKLQSTEENLTSIQNRLNGLEGPSIEKSEEKSYKQKYDLLFGQKSILQQQLANLVRQGKALHLPKLITQNAQDILRDTIISITAASQTGAAEQDSARSRRKSVFSGNVDSAEAKMRVKLAMSTFGNLYNYGKLRERKPVVDP